MRFGARVIGLAANAVVIGCSTVCFRADLLQRLSFWVVIGVATLLCHADLVRERTTSISDRLPTSTSLRLLCHLTGLVVFIVWWTAIMFASADRSVVASLWLLLGVAVAIVGAVIRKKAVLSLGEEFVSDVRPMGGCEALKTSGVYSRVRHPSELGLLLMCLGGGFASGSILSLVVSVCVLLPLCFARVQFEEGSLREEFGELYVAYQRRTGRFLPRMLVRPS